VKRIQFKSAEGAVRFYLLLDEEMLRYVPAIYPGEKVYLPKKIPCPKCGGRDFRWSESKKKGARWICAASKCGRDWPTHPVVDSVRGGRHGSPPMEKFRDLFVDLGRILFLPAAKGGISGEERQVLFGYVQLQDQPLPHGSRRVQVLAHALQRRRGSSKWTVYRVRQLLDSARRKVERQLEVASLLQGE
jgi:hypothetical protein